MDFNETKEIAKKALEFASSNDLEPIVSFYLEPELSKNIIKRLDPKLKDIFEKYEYSRDLFIKEAIKVLGEEKKDYTYYVYYATPISEKTEIMIIENNWIPPKAVILKGKVRFTFMPYSTIEDMEKKIKTQNDDDIIVEFENGIVKNYDRKRNIFTDFRNVTEVLQSKKPVVVNLFSSLESILPLTILSNNVYPFKNRIEIINNNGNFTFKILEGKANKEDVKNGETLTAETKAELYYDLKKNRVDTKTILNGLIYKLPIL